MVEWLTQFNAKLSEVAILVSLLALRYCVKASALQYQYPRIKAITGFPWVFLLIILCVQPTLVLKLLYFQ